MSAGPKDTPEKSLFADPNIPPKQEPGTVEDKTSISPPDQPDKSGKHDAKAGFGEANYYRQGVLVRGGPGKGPMPRGRSR
jgi:hypothetical protein